MRRRFRKFALVATSVVAVLVCSPLTAVAAGTLDQHQDNTSNDGAVWGAGYTHAQTFTAQLSGKLDTVSLFLDVEGADGTIPPAGEDLKIVIYNTAAGIPGGSVLAQQTLRASTGGAWNDIAFTTPPDVVAGTMYAIAATPALSLYLNWRGNCDGDLYAAGEALILDNYHDPAVWQTILAWAAANQGGSNACTRDYAFRTYVTVPTAATPTPTAPTATPTPFSSIQGATSNPTATPPPTSAAADPGSGDGASTVPLFLLMAAAGLAVTRFVIRREAMIRG